MHGDDEVPDSTPAGPKLPLRTKLGYGTAEFGNIAVEALARFHVLKFYTDVAGLRPDLASVAAAIAIVWDGLADLFIGLVSDRTRSSLGRRRPYIIAGGIFLAMTTILVFRPPAILNQYIKAAMLLLSFMAMNTSISLLAVPHSALSADMTRDRNERTELFGYRLFLGNLGLLVGAILPMYFLGRAEKGEITIESAYRLTTYILGAAVLATAMTTFAATKGRDRGKPDVGPMGFWLVARSMRDVVKDSTYGPLVLSYMAAQFGIAVYGTFAPYYYQYRLGISHDQEMIIIGVFIGTWILSIPPWVLVARKYGKRWPSIVGVTLVGILNSVCYPLCPPHSMVLPCLISGFGGALAGSMVLIEALVIDVVDVDEMRTRRRREGLYFATWKVAAKAARGLSVFASGFVLTAIGYVTNEDGAPVTAQPPEVGTRLGWIFGPAVGGSFLIGVVVFLCMPLTDAKYARVQRVLEKRREKAKRRGSLTSMPDAP
ncbi:MAG: MFS transporter [Polyangiaceae bacterium]